MSQTHFELFGLPEQFSLDLDDLAKRYRDLQKTTHPDRFSNASDQEKRMAMQLAGQVNEGFQTLKDPLRRAKYLLEINDVVVDNEKDTQMDPMFLMEQMELREELSEARDTGDPLATLDDLMQKVNARINKLIEKFATQYSPTCDNAKAHARETVRKLQFLYKLRSEAEELTAELEDEMF